jgi:NTE family protein
MNEMRPPRAKARKHDISAIASRYDWVALVLQGGGALGAYQIGVHQALAEAGCEPNWISGVSIGSINSAIIAGNGPKKRLQNLEAFWSTISGRKIWAYTPEGDIFRDFRNQTSSLMTLFFGQPGFFQPRLPNPWLHLPGAQGATSYYDSDALRDTLEKLIDFDLLNDGHKRLSVGAVNVRTGNFVYFDTINDLKCRLSVGAVGITSGNFRYFDNVEFKRQGKLIGPEHIMASGALPPAFPAVKIEGNIIGTVASSRTRRCNICWNRTSTNRRSFFRWTSLARAAPFPDRCRMSSPATRKSCTRAEPARIPMPSPAPTI